MIIRYISSELETNAFNTLSAAEEQVGKSNIQIWGKCLKLWDDKNHVFFGLLCLSVSLSVYIHSQVWSTDAETSSFSDTDYKQN